MATPMTVTPEPVDAPKVPLDSFGNRLALVRTEMKMNVSRIAALCGLDDESWRKWERGRRPQDREGICHAISDNTGYDYDWLMRGGPCRSSWFVSSALLTGLPPMLGQGILFDPAEPSIDERVLSLVGAP